MVNSRQLARRKKSRLLLLCLIIGFLYGLEQRYHFFRLRTIASSVNSIISGDIIWSAIPDNVENFWPLLFFRYYNIKDEVERHYPLKVDIRCLGWGKFEVDMQALQPRYLLMWSNRFWYISDDGKIWLVDLPVNRVVKGIAPPKSPLLVWDEKMPLPVGSGLEKGDIVLSSIPIKKIKGWYDEIEKIGWSHKIKRMKAMRQDGRLVMKIEFKDKSNKTKTLLLRDYPQGWQNIATALRGIEKDIKMLSGDVSERRSLYVDATYDGKIIVHSEDLKLEVSE